MESEYADIYALGWVSRLRSALAGIAVKLGMEDIDLSSLERPEPRLLTQRAGRIAFELGSLNRKVLSEREGSTPFFCIIKSFTFVSLRIESASLKFAQRSLVR